MRLYYFLLISILILMILSISYAEEANPKSEDTWIKWAWGMSGKMYEDYPITTCSFWRPETLPLTLVTNLNHVRDREEVDSYEAMQLVLFHPVVLDFSNVYMGMGGFFRVNAIHQEGMLAIDPFGNRPITETDIQPLAGGFSMICSFPEQGIQMFFTVGHYWNRIVTKIDTAFPAIPLPPPFPPIPAAEAKVKRIQKDTGVDISYKMTLNTDERPFLSGVELHYLGYYRTGHPKVSNRLIHPNPFIGVIELDKTPGRTDFSDVRLLPRIINIELGPMPAHPLHTDYIRRCMLSIDMFTRIAHINAENGHILSLGARVDLAGILKFVYFHNWEQKNDVADSDFFGLEFIIAV